MTKISRALALFSGILAVSGLSMNGSQKIYVDTLQAGSQQLAYPVNDSNAPALSASPEGYVPFHIEHYGRHGSRWLLSKSDYDKPVEYLEKADKYDKLTPRGKEVLEELKQIQTDSRRRLGELTPLGHRQHRGIASRMMRNFPEVFTDSTYIDAKSTVVIRCILSMANEIAEIHKLFPDAPFKMDASYTTQNILAYNSLDTVAKNKSAEARHFVKEYKETLPKPDSFYKKLFNDRQFVTDSLDETDVFDTVFYIAINNQSHDGYASLYDLFTPEELNNAWLAKNANWYITSANTPLTGNRVPFNQRVLLDNIITSADTAMTSKNISVNLRFGHESILMPLSILMELNNAAYETDDLSTLADHWRNFEIFPMASNIQIIFYRPVGIQNPTPDNVLVKVLLNEAEAELPVKAVTGKYYSWPELRSYYREKLDSFSTRFPE